MCIHRKTLKKAILAALMVVIIYAPCLAGVESDSTLSIEGTLWEGIALYPLPEYGQSVIELGFYNGKVFINDADLGMMELPTSFYADSQFLSFFNGSIAQGDVQPCIWRCYPTKLFGVIQPAVKMGTFIARIHYLFYITQTVIAVLHETDDNWIPEQP